MAVAQGYGKTVTSGSVFAYDVADTRNSYKGEPTTNVATGTLTPYTPYNTMTRSGQNLTITMVGGSALYLTFHNGTDYNGQTITLSGYMFKNGTPHTLPNNRANTYHTVAASKWYFDSVTGYFEIVEVCNASSIWLFHTPSGASGGDVITILDFQVEVKTHATPFVNGTRSATQGLLPLVGNSTIDLSNVSFDSNAQMTFDGTDDAGIVSNFALSTNYSYEGVFYIDPSDNGYSGFFSNMNSPSGVGGTGNGWVLRVEPGGALQLYVKNNSSTYNLPINVAGFRAAYAGQKLHVVYKCSSNYNAIHINGELFAEHTGYSTGILPIDSQLLFGAYDWGIVGQRYYLKGYAYLVKAYNRALTAAEINQNYLHYKTRFNLS